MDKRIKVSTSVRLASWEKVRHPGSHGTRLEPLAKILSLNNLWISVTINLASAQLEGSHSSKEDISKELVISSSLPLGQEAASSKRRIDLARIPQLSPTSRLRSRGRGIIFKQLSRENTQSRWERVSGSVPTRLSQEANSKGRRCTICINRSNLLENRKWNTNKCQ